MKFENLKVKEIVLDIDEMLNISKINKDDFVKYLKSRKREKFLVFESYENRKEAMATTELVQLRKKVDFMISRIKKGDKNLKIKSLEERFLNQKNIILSNLERNLEGYKKTIQYLNEKLNKFNNEQAYIGYLFVKGQVENEVVLVFPIKIEYEKGSIYIRNDLEKDILSNKFVFKNINFIENIQEEISENLKQIEEDIVEKIGFVNIEFNAKSISEDLLQTKNLSDRMRSIINQTQINNISKFKTDVDILKTNNTDILYIVTQKEDFVLKSNKYRVKLLEIIENLLINGEKILVVAQNIEDIKSEVEQKILKKEYNDKIYEIKNCDILSNIKNINSLIKKKTKIKNIINRKTEFGLSLETMYDVVRKYDLYNNEEHLRYKKNLNLENVTYKELEESLKTISEEDIECYKVYKGYKEKFITFNEYPYSFEELENIKNIIKKMEFVAQEKCKINKKYFKKIMFRIKNKASKLELEDLRELGREIAREENRELLEGKATWSIKNIFNTTKYKEKRREELEFFKEKEIQEIKNIISFYKEIELNYIILEAIDESLLKEIIVLLCKDNYKEELSKKMNSIEFSLKNKETLTSINSWSNLKVALVDYLYKSNDLKGSKEKLVIFKVSDEFLKISKEYGINIIKEYEDYKKDKSNDLDILIEHREELFNQYLIKKYKIDNYLDIYNFESTKNLELREGIYDTIILIECDVKKEDDILPLIYRGKRCLSFRNISKQNKYEMNFKKLD